VEAKTILIVEDEPTIQNVVKKYFESEGFHVITANDGFAALEQFNANHIDLICLDIMMPNIDGWTVTETIRETSDVPIIIMTALSSEENVLKGYEYRIDDYITKPFNPKILVAKSKSLLNRINSPTPVDKKQTSSLVFGPLDLNPTTMLFKVDGRIVELSKTEFDLIHFFMDHQQQVCSRDLILSSVWGDSAVETRIVDTYIKKIRKLLGPHAKMISTVFGSGYRFEATNESI
jgi:two-component system response regulator VanR